MYFSEFCKKVGEFRENMRWLTGEIGLRFAAEGRRPPSGQDDALGVDCTPITVIISPLRVLISPALYFFCLRVVSNALLS